MKIGIVLGSTRPGRLGDQVARWVHERAVDRVDAEFALVDLRDHPLPHLEEPPGFSGQYRDERTRAWAATVAACDGFVFVTPEYHHSVPGVLKNALDHVHVEWNTKAAGFVSYGGAGGARSVEQLRLVCGALQLADVAPQVTLPLATEFENRTEFKPGGHQLAALDLLLDHVVAWSTALATLRHGDAGAAIRQRLDAIVDGLRAKDLEALRRSYAPDVVSYDVEPPLQHVGVDAKLENWAKVFAVFEKVDYELRGLTVDVSGDLAVGHGFGRVSGTLKNGVVTDGMWVRATFVFRHTGDGWVIVHDQASVPFDVASGRGMSDLEP
ncbi:NAD(P)H-dependent oxidoreductase [Amycolatopsis vancoresmycina]|uniref:NADPH-dependent FMN reductase n=1 Tax=Amycolatopsis vancoresmycina DSM 44592 TaxID=1292037 RepID=R1H887_9PSEU|nr:NAD(P)H-dependent oxidoreductase [Amycolatopsis vancoresmycina]EOD59845.1 NADPH-dependent FMN reductase [Amycolatopsis vancoresmycina DSM 44592]